MLAGLGVLLSAAGCRRARARALRARSCEFRRPQSPRARAYTLLCMTVLFSSTGILAALYDQRERHVGAPLRNADHLHDSYVGVPQRPRHGSRRLSRARRGHLQLLQIRNRWRAVAARGWVPGPVHDDEHTHSEPRRTPACGGGQRLRDERLERRVLRQMLGLCRRPSLAHHEHGYRHRHKGHCTGRVLRRSQHSRPRWWRQLS